MMMYARARAPRRARAVDRRSMARVYILKYMCKTLSLLYYPRYMRRGACRYRYGVIITPYRTSGGVTPGVRLYGCTAGVHFKHDVNSNVNPVWSMHCAAPPPAARCLMVAATIHPALHVF
eukprot:SAG31_NODE_347_length_17310_cov_3.764743_5_plen_120_part_00